MYECITISAADVYSCFKNFMVHTQYSSFLLLMRWKWTNSLLSNMTLNTHDGWSEPLSRKNPSFVFTWQVKCIFSVIVSHTRVDTFWPECTLYPCLIFIPYWWEWLPKLRNSLNIVNDKNNYYVTLLSKEYTVNRSKGERLMRVECRNYINFYQYRILRRDLYGRYETRGCRKWVSGCGKLEDLFPPDYARKHINSALQIEDLFLDTVWRLLIPKSFSI